MAVCFTLPVVVVEGSNASGGYSAPAEKDGSAMCLGCLGPRSHSCSDSDSDSDDDSDRAALSTDESELLSLSESTFGRVPAPNPSTGSCAPAESVACPALCFLLPCGRLTGLNSFAFARASSCRCTASVAVVAAVRLPGLPPITLGTPKNGSVARYAGVSPVAVPVAAGCCLPMRPRSLSQKRGSLTSTSSEDFAPAEPAAAVSLLQTRATW